MRRSHLLFRVAIVALVVLTFFSRHVLRTFWTLATLHLTWHIDEDQFILSETNDDFDVTFAAYDVHQLSAAPHVDRVPPIIHHVALGKRRLDRQSTWKESVDSCVAMHPGWEHRVWTDQEAAELVATKYPELQDMWEQYPYNVERIDALRYMVLYEYGGAVLDMDLKCKRALGPLRRFEFAAPKAHPVGFSVGFMMAEPKNPFVGSLLSNLTVYDHHWFGLPYPTVMFSTGCHFASVIHARHGDRQNLKILPGPLHSLNGNAETPIFHHLGSSSWHGYDARLLKTLHKSLSLVLMVAVLMVACASWVFWSRRRALTLAAKNNEWSEDWRLSGGKARESSTFSDRERGH